MPMEVAYTPKPEGEAGAILGRLEWNTKQGKLLRCDRAQNAAGEWTTTKVDISTIDQPDGSVVRPTMLFDFHSAQNGWMRFRPFDERMAHIDGALPPRPPEYRDENGNAVMDNYGKPIRHEQVVRVPVYSPKTFGTTAPVWELSIRGGHALVAIQAFYALVEASPEHAAGKLPLVRWDKARIIDKNGNSVPTWTITGWHARPAEFPARQAAAPAPVVAAPAPKPAAPQQPATAQADAELADDLPF